MDLYGTPSVAFRNARECEDQRTAAEGVPFRPHFPDTVSYPAPGQE